MDSQIPSSNSVESGEVIEGRVLSDEEVIRMERKETSDRTMNSIMAQIDRENYRQMQNLINKNLHSAFFRDL